MFDQTVAGSEALRSTPAGVLRPALCVCARCGGMRMITAPGPVICAECGGDAEMSPEGAKAPVGGSR